MIEDETRSHTVSPPIPRGTRPEDPGHAAKRPRVDLPPGRLYRQPRMFRHLRLAAIARLAAALVAVTLSGAPRVLALNAPPEKHRCTCRHAGGHACECAMCHKAALTHQATDESLPPCHRAAARNALASAGDGRARGEACVEGTCGAGAHPALTLAGVEVFCLPALGPVVAPLPERPLATFVEPLHDRALEPETPPPRPA